MSRTNFHGPKGIRANEVRLYNKNKNIYQKHFLLEMDMQMIKMDKSTGQKWLAVTVV